MDFIYISKVAVEDFHVEVDGLKASKLVVVEIDAHDEEKTDISSVNELVIAVLDKVAELAIPRVEKSVYIHRQLTFLFLVVRDVPLVQTGLPHSILDKEIMNHPLFLCVYVCVLSLFYVLFLCFFVFCVFFLFKLNFFHFIEKIIICYIFFPFHWKKLRII